MENNVSAAIFDSATIKKIEMLLDWKQTLTETDKTLYRDYLLVQWNLSKEALEVAKANEMELRKKIVSFAFDPDKKSGTERIELGNGYEAKAVKKLNYGFVKNDKTGKTDKTAIDLALTAIEQRSPAGAYIAEHLVKWTPELSLTEYKKLPNEDKAIIDKVIVTSDGAPTLEIIEPKGSK